MPSLTRYRVAFLAALFAFSTPLFAADPAPWLIPANAAKFVFVGKQVWDVDSAKLVSPTGAPALETPGWPILGVTDRYYLDMNFHYPGLPGMITPGRVFSWDKSINIFPTFDGKPPQDYGHPGFWMNADARRVVWIEKGDYWRGEADWSNGTIVNRKKVTNTNAFDAHNTPFLWWGQYLFVYGGFDKDKPIVRINLANGDTDELANSPVFNLNAERTLGGFVSPDFDHTIFAAPEVVHCYNVPTGQAYDIRNPFPGTPGSAHQPAQPPQPLFAQQPPVWTDDTTVYSIDAGIHVVKIDLRTGRAEIIVQPDAPQVGQQSPMYQIVGVVPGNHFVDIITEGSGNTPHPVFKDRFLLELATGKKTPLPLKDGDFAKWFDENTCIYVRKTGGLSSVGTWLYDRPSNTTKRLTGKQIEFTRAMLTADHTQLWTVTTGGGEGYSLNRVKLDGSGLDELGPSNLDTPVQMPAGSPIDLGLAGTVTDLWKPPVIDAAALAPTTASPQAAPAQAGDAVSPAPAVIPSAAPAAPATQPQQTAANQANPSPPPPPPSPLNKTNKEIKKAQDAANLLHNLFGH